MDLLLKITSNKKYIVTKRRVKILQEVEPQHLANVLLRRYQNLRPDLVKEKVSMKSMIRRTAKHFDGLMERTFGEIWSDPKHKGEEAELSFDVSTVYNSLIPSLTFESIGQSEQSYPTKSKQGIKECKSVQDLVSSIRQGLKMPDQALSLLNNPTLCTLLLLNPTPTEIQERLSITLYFTLHNEFLSMSRNQKQSQQKKDLLCRINMLQESLQYGLPVVGRFLAEYLVAWDGNEYFNEICKMLSFMPITDFAGNVEKNLCFYSLPKSNCSNCRTWWMYPWTYPVVVQWQQTTVEKADCFAWLLSSTCPALGFAPVLRMWRWAFCLTKRTLPLGKHIVRQPFWKHQRFVWFHFTTG